MGPTSLKKMFRGMALPSRTNRHAARLPGEAKRLDL
jgi:hypothetical protein